MTVTRAIGILVVAAVIIVVLMALFGIDVSG